MTAPATESGYLESLIAEVEPGSRMTTPTTQPSEAAEQAVIAYILLKGHIHTATLDTITPSDFGNASHRKIYDAVLALHRRGESIDIITIMDELGPILDHIGGPAYLTSLTGGLFSTGSIESYNRIILEAAGQRKLTAIATMIQAGIRDSQDISELTDTILKTLENIRARTGVTNARRFSFSSFDEILADQKPTEWLIRDFLDKGKLAEIYGPSDSLKSFIAISMGLSIATGLPWFGNPVKVTGPCLYICGEGRHGVRKRLKVWSIENNTSQAPFYVSKTSAAITDPAGLSEVDTAIANIPGGPPALVIIDTLARNFGPGDENSTADMGRFVVGMDRIKDRYGCTILVVHHTGLATSDRDRGSSVLKASVDSQYSVKRVVDTVTMTCIKAKDHEQPAPITFKPRVIETGDFDDDHRPITSLVLDKVNGAEITKRQLPNIPLTQRIALDALETVSKDTGKAHIEVWRQEAYRLGISGTPNSKRQAFNRARTALLGNGTIQVDSDLYWIALHSVTKRDNVTACSGGSTVTKRDTPLKGCHACHAPKPENDHVELII